MNYLTRIAASKILFTLLVSQNTFSLTYTQTLKRKISESETPTPFLEQQQ